MIKIKMINTTYYLSKNVSLLLKNIYKYNELINMSGEYALKEKNRTA